MEREWRWRQPNKLSDIALDFIKGGSRKMRRSVEEDLHKLEIRSRRITVILAARAFELDNGRAPTRIEQLLPAYLSAVPVDPKTGQAIPFSLELPLSPR